MNNFEGRSRPFYRESLQLLLRSRLPFMVGGAYAFSLYTGISRHTKDFDLFVRQRDFAKALKIFRDAGYRAEETFSHWLGKVFTQKDCIDVIYRAGNGLGEVDDLWFEHAPERTLFELPVLLTPPEEMIWMKAYIMERERYDGADVAHLFFHCAAKLDWARLLRRFGPDWRVLLSHLILFGFIYPAHRDRIPPEVMGELLERLRKEDAANEQTSTCRGTLLSRVQFLPEIRSGDFRDARLEPRSEMTQAEIDAWTVAAEIESTFQPATDED